MLYSVSLSKYISLYINIYVKDSADSIIVLDSTSSTKIIFRWNYIIYTHTYTHTHTHTHTHIYI